MRMVDLATQYARLKPRIDEAIQSVLAGAQFVKGPQVKVFEENLANYMGVKHVISCANGTDALQIAFMALGLEPGDEVITPSHTYVATVEVIALLRLKPVFVEVYPDTYTIDVDAVRRAITSKTKAIVPVHLYGQCAYMEPLLKLASEYGLYVIEDNAQAIGATYQFTDGRQAKGGTIGHVGTTSFFPSKNLGCYGDGGALFTNDDTLAKTIRMIANHGQEVTYVHDLVGVNSRLDSLQAAILDVKLKELDDFAARRRAVADAYDRALANIPGVHIPHRASYSTHVFHQYTLRLEGIDRDAVKNELQKLGIPSMIYYPIPVHLQKAYRHYGFAEGSLPVTEKLSKSVISLPMHTEMQPEQITYITENFISIVSSLQNL
ncbi:MAG: DegT/DnrJ/EryC1/StrS family aminotransferase [Chitinophagales bacterium]|nr:DegT/DnrJ/EryC1/StrS family aminotransferase [Chitinophagales bacterium]